LQFIVSRYKRCIGKTNQFNNREYAACMRAKDVRVCGIGALAQYLFYRFTVCGTESLPDFADRTQWFNIKVSIYNNTNCFAAFAKLKKLLKNHAKGKLLEDPISKTGHAKNLKAVFEHLGIHSKRSGKITHIGRKNGAKMAEFVGIPANSIRQGGRWNNQALENCYLESIPRDFLRGMAGFDARRKSFYLPRVSLRPSQELKALVFPELRSWRNRLESNDLEVTVSLELFLRLLDDLSEVLLQDAPLMMRHYPHLSIWAHALFATPEFCQFRAQQLAMLQTAVAPTDLRIQEVLPDLLARIDEQGTASQTAAAANSLKLDALTGKFSHLMQRAGAHIF
jgi:hypothetical protein